MKVSQTPMNDLPTADDDYRGHTLAWRLVLLRRYFGRFHPSVEDYTIPYSTDSPPMPEGRDSDRTVAVGAII